MKHILKTLLHVPALLCLIASPLVAAERNAAVKPNVLVFIVDQLFADAMSCAGRTFVKTPAMDSLAAEGARFARAYCADPVCVPSRFSMLTGAMPSHAGIETNEDMRKSKVTPEIVQNTMGQIFAKAGYETVYGGKQHVPVKIEAAGFRDIGPNAGPGLVDASVKFLRQPHERPFLMVASLINPHDICFMAIKNLTSPEEFKAPQPLVDAMTLPAGMSREEFFAKLCPPLPANYAIPQGEPEAILAADKRAFRTSTRSSWSDEQWRMHRWAYARLTEHVDGQIGAVLAVLRETGLEKNTLVVFTSDHGDMDASHHLEHKSVLYDEATRVPFIVSWKGHTKPGLVDNEHLVSSGIDLIPTLCDFADIPQPASLKGRSVRALAEGRASAWRDTLVVENGESRMLRSARYKYVVYATGARREMLTDMLTDSGEMKNLALDPTFVSVLKDHRRMLKEWYQQNGETLDPRYVVSEN